MLITGCSRCVVVVRLIELIQDGATSLVVDVRDLGHNLLRSVSDATYLCLLHGTGGVLVSVVRGVVVLFIGRAHAEIKNIILLVVNDARLLQHILHVLQSVSIVGVETVSAELSQLAFRHLSGLFLLLCSQLDLSGIDGG